MFWAPLDCETVRTWLVLRITSPTVERKRSSVRVLTRTVGGGRGASSRGAGGALARGARPGLSPFFFRAADPGAPRRGHELRIGGGPRRSAHCCDHRLERGEPAEQERKLLASVDPTGLPHQLHAVLELVRELGDRVIAERGRHALDRVRHPEHDVDRLDAARILLELEQGAADLGEVLRRLLDEDRPVLRQIHAQSSFFSSTLLSVAITESGLNGFTMKSRAPAWSASCTSVS